MIGVSKGRGNSDNKVMAQKVAAEGASLGLLQGQSEGCYRTMFSMRHNLREVDVGATRDQSLDFQCVKLHLTNRSHD